MNSSMMTRILSSFFLICSISGVWSVQEEIVDALENGALSPEEAFSDLVVFDDDGKPVKIDFDLNDPESEEETRQQLKNRVIFHLHTRSNPKQPKTLRVGDVAALNKSDFNPKKHTKFITHGWMQSSKNDACTKVRDGFLNNGDYNIIVVDWQKISKRPYLWVSRRIPMISKYVSSMINFLEEQGMDISKVTVVGHSLGAHIAGLSSHYAKKRVDFVVGLDPAYPNFEIAGVGSRIASGDANYVQIIHTNGGLLGFKSAIGDSDFYPNGGTAQVGCTVDVAGACSHLRSVYYFAESLNSKSGFWASKCQNVADVDKHNCKTKPEAVMGGAVPDLKVKGVYYLKTSKSSPYALGN
ncbi:phospholipase A1 VesT1.02-like [Colletes gigas]|uniref:phospholipase A1 VesT1.02-like n=1 Tax=Colletes gigas TaxID=935657 RepID=UPI001C9B47E0|nr:phospholipase A1 VesT1.02-like [Colletes gigas]